MKGGDEMAVRELIEFRGTRIIESVYLVENGEPQVRRRSPDAERRD
jgi:hypothetical protein